MSLSKIINEEYVTLKIQKCLEDSELGLTLWCMRVDTIFLMVLGMEWLLTNRRIPRELTEVARPLIMCGEVEPLSFFVSSFLFACLESLWQRNLLEGDVISVLSLPMLLEKVGCSLPSCLQTQSAMAGLLEPHG